MKGTEFDEKRFFAAIAASGTRALLIGRRALVLLGLPVMTVDYDFWIDIEAIDSFNAAAAPFGLVPSHSAAEARGRGRYVLQNDEIVDVLVARSLTTVEGARVVFDELWGRRRTVGFGDATAVAIPSIGDLIATKRFASRPKDAEDIRWLELLRAKEQQ
jgi:hypothetical protein